MISYFRANKASQTAARLLDGHTGPVDLQRLGSLLYLVERESLIRFGAPVAHDDYIVKPSGITVVSVFERHHDHAAVPIIEDGLSPAEHRLIDEILVRHGGWDTATLLEFTRALPEWREPRNDSTQIDPDEILRLAGFSVADREQMSAEWDEAAYARSVFA